MATVPRRDAEGAAKGDKAKVIHREELPGYQLNLLLQSQSPSLKRPLQRRERRYPKGKGKAGAGKVGKNPQKMEMPKQTLRRKLKVLQVPSE
ncbi:Dresden prostate carcinoma protein 2 [Myotis davidii]|uniref:Dresden prostate carcinoma protein 2 n=1 Tax=Myotis davidii TaxID=225400 RepID=L5LWE3_MYODS|nr:Dresden prostate carcinoma protein 2 [Myotis davidii]